MAKSLFIFIFFYFLFLLLLDLLHKEEVWESVISQVSCYVTKSHEECGKVAHRPGSSCISSIQEINKDSIEFSLSTWTWRVIELSSKLLHWWANYHTVFKSYQDLS